MRLRGTIVVTAKDVAHRATVRNHISLEVPGAAQSMLEQKLVGAGGLAVDRVIRTHDRSRVPFNHRSAKRRHVRVFLIVLTYVNIREVASGLRPAVHREMLGC